VRAIFRRGIGKSEQNSEKNLKCRIEKNLFLLSHMINDGRKVSRSVQLILQDCLAISCEHASDTETRWIRWVTILYKNICDHL
jgi:hypothetical protein